MQQKNLKSFLRGGQTTIHTFRMAGQVISVMTMGFASLLVVVMVAWTFLSTDSYDRYLAYKYAIARSLVFFSVDEGRVMSLRLPDGERRDVAIEDFLKNDAVIEARNEVLNRFSDASVYGALAGTGMALWIMWFFLNRGGAIAKEKHLRGAEETTPKRLKQLITAANNKQNGILFSRLPGLYRPYNLVGVPYPYRAETLHTLIAGTTGAGKTQTIIKLLKQIRERGDRAVVFDPMGNYAEAYFDASKDIILNPLDARCKNWSIFHDAEMSADYDAITAAMIPMGGNDNPVWAEAARTVFSVTAQLIKGDAIGAGTPEKATNKKLVETLLTSTPEYLEEFLTGTVAAQIVTTKAERMAAGVRMMLSTYLRALAMMPDDGEPFSISEWINNDHTDAVLFLTSVARVQESLKPLITVWMDVAIKSLLSRTRDRDRTIWFIFDELARLHQLPSLKQGMKEGRQFGAAFVIGVQARALLKEIYGNDGAMAINGLCRNKLILPAADFHEAEWYANDIGRREIRRMEEGVSFGASEIRDGVNLSARDKHELIVLPEELMNLPNLTGFLKMAEGFPAARVTQTYIQPNTIADAFIPRANIADLIKRTVPEKDAKSGQPVEQDAVQQERPASKKKSPRERLKQAQFNLDGDGDGGGRTPQNVDQQDREREADSLFIHEI